jgi:hypothetical protein
MDVWENDFLDLVDEAHLTFRGKSDGEIAFGALKGFLDVRYGTRDGSACAEFSWEGHDENDPACGRGWVMIGTAGRQGQRVSRSPRPRVLQARFFAKYSTDLLVNARMKSIVSRDAARNNPSVGV